MRLITFTRSSEKNKKNKKINSVRTMQDADLYCEKMWKYSIHETQKINLACMLSIISNRMQHKPE